MAEYKCVQMFYGTGGGMGHDQCPGATDIARSAGLRKHGTLASTLRGSLLTTAHMKKL